MLVAPRLDILLAHLFETDTVLAQVLEDRIYRASIPQSQRDYPSLTFFIEATAAIEGRTDQLDLTATVRVTGEGTDMETLLPAGDRADYLVRTLDGTVGGVRFFHPRKNGELDLTEI